MIISSVVNLKLVKISHFVIIRYYISNLHTIKLPIKLKTLTLASMLASKITRLHNSMSSRSELEFDWSDFV